MKNVKAQAGTTATWIVAIFIILFISIFFIFGVLFLAEKQNASETISTITAQETNTINEDIALQRSLESFLEKTVTFEEKEKTIAQIIKENEIKENSASAEFKKIAKPIFSELLSDKADSNSQWWLRVYNKGEKIDALDRLNTEEFHVGGFVCNPNDTKDNLITSYFIGDKKIIFCITKSRYRNWKNNKYE